MGYLHIKAFCPVRHPQPFIVVNEKCSKLKIKSFADAAEAKGDILKEHMEASATNRGCHQRGFPGGFAAYARCPLISSLYPCALCLKQDRITNGKHNIWQLISFIKT